MTCVVCDDLGCEHCPRIESEWPDYMADVRCPLCGTRVVTTEAPCECGFRFPRGYGELQATCPTTDMTPADFDYGLGELDCGGE